MGDSIHFDMEFLPGRYVKFSEGSIAKQRSEEYKKLDTTPLQGIDKSTCMASLECTFEELIGMKLQRYFDKEMDNMPVILKATVPYWTSQETIRCMLKNSTHQTHSELPPESRRKLVKDIAKITFEVLWEMARLTFKSRPGSGVIGVLGARNTDLIKDVILSEETSIKDQADKNEKHKLNDCIRAFVGEAFQKYRCKDLSL